MQPKSIYTRMAELRLKIAAAQIDLLNHYDPKNKERRMEILYKHRAIIESPSEKSIENMEELIRKYNCNISHFRQSHPNIENSQRVERKRIEKLKKRWAKLIKHFNALFINLASPLFILKSQH